MAHIIDRETWTRTPGRWQGVLQCGAYGSNSCLIFNYQEEIGGGPRLHTHPYCEIFIIRQGTGLFTIGDQQIEATAGQIRQLHHRMAGMIVCRPAAFSLHRA
ncbi:cupin domain-containing protein [Mesorhizobium sp. M0676]|uniref:cupin domain-containing protein n=1 Tax=Mesorhizobium sp. M0676 TaxID=2956984 RepID=UPI0033350FAE